MNDKTTLTRLCVAASFALLSALAWGCEEGAEGDRCNPDLSHDECHSGLSCQQPVNCPENYCCPTTGTSTNPFCQPGCNGDLASICTDDPTDDACGSDADSGESSDGAPADAGSAADSAPGDGAIRGG